MNRHGIDVDALMRHFEEASAKQGGALEKAVHDATLKALQGRELTLKSIKGVLKAVTQAVSAGAERRPPGADVAPLLEKAVAGMDAALLQAVEANRRALQRLVEQGVDLQDRQLRKALSDIEKMEDTLFAAIRKAAEDAAGAMQGPWAQALQAVHRDGSATGSAALGAIETLTSNSRAAVRDGRALGQRAARALLDHYAALASGVLIGMSGAMAAPAAAPRARAKR